MLNETHDDELEAILAEHSVAVISTTGDLIDGICCASPECVEKDADGDDLAIEFPDMEAFVAHQAAVVRAAGWHRDCTRWETTLNGKTASQWNEEA